MYKECGGKNKFVVLFIVLLSICFVFFVYTVHEEENKTEITDSLYCIDLGVDTVFAVSIRDIKQVQMNKDNFVWLHVKK